MEPTVTAWHEYRNFGCSACGYAFRAPVSCGNRFCDVCTAPRSRNIRAKITAIVDSVHLLPGERFRLLTLSISNASDLKEQSRVLLRAFRRLRQRQYWKSKVTGGTFVLEVKGSPGNWHIHIHAIICSKFMSYKRLLKLWMKVSGGRGCHLKTIKKSVIIGYITKYVTKSGLPVIAQIDASLALKNTRLFNPFGTWFALNRLIKRVNFVCPTCGEVSWYMTRQALDADTHTLLSALGEHDTDRWMEAESNRRAAGGT